MATVTAHSQTATYGYKTNTDLVETTTFNNGSSNIFTRTVAYDANYRIDQVTGTTSAGTIAKHDYSYDSRSRRTGVVREDSNTWTYGYNNKNEVESGVKKFSDNTNMPGHNFGFAYDSIGNRDSVTLDGTTYDYGAANSLNQLTTRVVPSSYTILGSAESDAKVMVNNRLASRKGEFWYKALTVDNDSSPAYLPVTIKGKLLGAGSSGEDVVAQQTGNLLVPETPETFVYDDDGNLTEDGLWTYTWDGENRLIQVQSASGVPAAAKKKLTFAYDGRSRRIQEKVYNWNSGSSTYVLQSTANFVYDGWNLVAETNGSETATKTFAWGLDLSGSQQGAGGVGGLLLVRNTVASKNHYAYTDGNGNVSKLVAATTGTVVAEYEYSPFGEVLVQSGEEASVNPIQWSSKYADSETKLSYYGYRFYGPSIGKWFNRDPIGEFGGVNLHEFSTNDPINIYDIDGRYLTPRIASPVTPGVRPIGPGLYPPIPIVPDPVNPHQPVEDEPNGPKPGDDNYEDWSGPEDLLYRGMQQNVLKELIFGGPQTGESARMLGVRPGKVGAENIDVEVDSANMINPKNSDGQYQGMSVAIRSPYNLKKWRRPKEWGGTGKDPVWYINSNNITQNEKLGVHKDSMTHALVYPTRCMKYSEYKEALEGTASSWVRISPGK